MTTTWPLLLAIAALFAGCGSSQPRPAEAAAREPAPSPGAATTNEGAPVCRGELAPADAGAVVREHADAFRACYRPIMEAQPDLEARLTLSMRIGPNGGVDAVDIESTFGDDQVTECFRAIALGMQFPPIAGGECAALRVPFIARPER